MELFRMIMVLLVIVLLASDYSRRKKGLDYEVPEKGLPSHNDYYNSEHYHSDYYHHYRNGRSNHLDDPSWW